MLHCQQRMQNAGIMPLSDDPGELAKNHQCPAAGQLARRPDPDPDPDLTQVPRHAFADVREVFKPAGGGCGSGFHAFHNLPLKPQLSTPHSQLVPPSHERLPQRPPIGI